MKKLGKKIESNKETITAYACECYCNNGCSCNCPIYYAQNGISNSIANVPSDWRSNASANTNYRPF